MTKIVPICRHVEDFISNKWNDSIISDLKDILLHFKSWNTGFDPVNKSDTFSSCYLHTENIKSIIFIVEITSDCDITSFVACIVFNLKETC